MQIISQPECHKWLKSNFGRSFMGNGLESVYKYQASYKMPTDTGRKTALARMMSNNINATHEGLFWITGWSVFPSSENMALFDAYRGFMGESRDICSAPGHIFNASDRQQLECLFGLSLYFFWDTSLFEGTGALAVRTSHDEVMSLFSKEEDRIEEIQSYITGLELKRV